MISTQIISAATISYSTAIPDCPDILTYVWLRKNTEYRRNQRLKRNRTQRCNFDEGDAKTLNKLTALARFPDWQAELSQNANYKFKTNKRAHQTWVTSHSHLGGSTAAACDILLRRLPQSNAARQKCRFIFDIKTLGPGAPPHMWYVPKKRAVWSRKTWGPRNQPDLKNLRSTRKALAQSEQPPPLDPSLH